MGVVARLARGLAGRRLAVYAGGLGGIVAARYGPVEGVLGPGATGAVVAAALGLMTVTYLAELAVDAGAFEGPEGHSTRGVVLVAVGLAGFAVAGFFLLDGRPLLGGPFLVGAVLLVRAGVRGRDGRERGTTG